MLNWIRTAVRPFPPIFGAMQAPELAIFDAAGNEIGFVELIEMQHATLTVSGWVMAGRVDMVLGGQRVSTVPNDLRQDVAQEKGLDPRAGFSLSLKASQTLLAQSDPPGLVFTPKPGACSIPPVSFVPPRPFLTLA